MLGAVIHTVNFRLPAEQVRFTIKHAKDEWLFILPSFREVVGKASESLPRFVWLSEAATEQRKAEVHYEALIEAGDADEVPEAEQVHEDDPFSIFYTTGTTGRPKGLLYRHRDMLLASLQIFHHLALHEGGSRPTSRDVFMPVIPFFHIHGWGVPLFVPYLGAKIVLAGFATPEEQVSFIERERVSWMSMVPTQLHMLLEAAQSTNTRL